jgi:hypothetical protein
VKKAKFRTLSLPASDFFSCFLVRGQNIDRIFKHVQLLEEWMDGGRSFCGSDHHDTPEIRGD